MKIKRTVLLSFAVLPLIISLIALIFLPEEIPAHYGANFTVDRYGSKLEVLIFPIEILVLSLIFLLPGIFMENELNKRLMLNIGLALILVFNALDYYILFIQANNVTNINSGVFSIERILILIFGVLFIFIGNLMLLSRRNSFVGLRTKWSMSSDTVWKKCQIFGGVSMIILGVVLLIIAFAFPNIFLMIGLLLITAVIDTIYSYLAAKKYKHTSD
ncbi:MAG: SdpI family protein [Ruminococcus sp.]|nr:SdpI family protein [Ruminococcus sp.]